jgi:hypothetical protein
LPPQTLTRVPRSRPAVGRIVAYLGIALAGIAMIALLSWIVRGPAFVERVTIANPTRYDFNVDVAASDGRRLDLAYVEAGGSVAVRDVIEQGDTWTFRFSYGGTEAGSVSVDRARLERGDWIVEIPPRVEMRLDAAGFDSPRTS